MAAGSIGGYWDQYEPIKVGPSAAQPTLGSPNAQLAGGTAVTPALPTQQPQQVAPQGGGTDYQATFQRIMAGLPATPTNLAAKEQELAAAGITVKRNAEGTAGKIKLPTGQIVDVIQSAGAGGGGNWQWLTGGGGSLGTVGGYQMGQFTGGGQYPLASVTGPGLAAPWLTPFNAPTDVTEKNDPGFQFRLKEAQNAIERSAASRGTLLTGGLLKKLSGVMQDQASAEYGNVYGRQLGEYQMANQIYNQNQGNLFQRLGYLGSVGENAAAGVGNSITGAGNASAYGSIGQGNIWGNAAGNIGNTIGGAFTALNRPPQPNYYGTG